MTSGYNGQSEVAEISRPQLRYLTCKGVLLDALYRRNSNGDKRKALTESDENDRFSSVQSSENVRLIAVVAGRN